MRCAAAHQSPTEAQAARLWRDWGAHRGDSERQRAARDHPHLHAPTALDREAR